VEHYSYSSYSNNYDFLVLSLRKSLSYNSYVISISMGSASTGEWVTVAGRGENHEGGPKSNHLQKLTIPIMNDPDFKKAYPNEIYDSVQYASCTIKAGLDSCYGDSGGPLTRGTGTLAVLVGVVGWG
ncbi:uncharacterized protein TRIADDRAFT_7380, partial [Trichoplax adhaerens]